MNDTKNKVDAKFAAHLPTYLIKMIEAGETRIQMRMVKGTVKVVDEFQDVYYCYRRATICRDEAVTNGWYASWYVVGGAGGSSLADCKGNVDAKRDAK